MPLIVQTFLRPTEVLIALNQLAVPDVTRFRAAVAYVTRDGVETVFRDLRARIPAWKTIPKVLVTSFDFALTDPDALRQTLAEPNFDVFIANLVPRPGGGFGPSNRRNFHPKLYVFDRGPSRGLLVGSANLSGRAFDVNAEAGFLVRDADPAEVEPLWTALIRGAVALTPELLDEYAKGRKAHGPPIDPSPPLMAVDAPPPDQVQAFGDAVAGGFDPQQYDNFWVEAGSMSSGGSRNQLELPRGGNRFFGHNFTRYDRARKAASIGSIDLLAKEQAYYGRPLTWHGHNRMERLNLPTEAKGGFSYAGTAVLFRRRGTRFAVEVAPWGSAKAIAWRNASTQAGLLFRLGETSRRYCGLF